MAMRRQRAHQRLAEVTGASGDEDVHRNSVYPDGMNPTFGRPTPELPVEDVERAQQHYRDVFGFEIGWLDPGGGIGVVWGDGVAIFFRRRERPFEPAVHWVFAEHRRDLKRPRSIEGERNAGNPPPQASKKRGLASHPIPVSGSAGQ